MVEEAPVNKWWWKCFDLVLEFGELEEDDDDELDELEEEAVKIVLDEALDFDLDFWTYFLTNLNMTNIKQTRKATNRPDMRNCWTGSSDIRKCLFELLLWFGFFTFILLANGLFWLL